MARVKHYVNNGHMLEAVIRYRNKRLAAIAAGEQEPPLCDYLGRCILLICQKMGSRPNFSGYSFRSEMESDAVLNCIVALRNFDPEKSSAVFGYLSRCAWRAFLRRIFDERKENYTKHLNASKLFSDGQHYTSHSDWQDPRAVSAYDKMNSKGVQSSEDFNAVVGASQDVINRFEETMAKKKRPAKEGVLTTVIPEDREAPEIDESYLF